MFINHILYVCALLMLFSFISGIIEYYVAQNHAELIFGLDWPKLWFIFSATLGFIFGLIKLGGYFATGN